MTIIFSHTLSVNFGGSFLQNLNVAQMKTTLGEYEGILHKKQKFCFPSYSSTTNRVIHSATKNHKAVKFYLSSKQLLPSVFTEQLFLNFAK